jgi:LmbE family N-acetylglucosaminyl deacetylase
MKRTIKKLLLKLGSRRRLQHLRALVRGTTLYDQAASLCEPGGGEIVVLAPHMDDEVLGCGGTIARHVQAGANVTVIFLTDGRYGGRISTAGSKDGRIFDRQEIVNTRKQEAQRAGEILGVRRILFLDAEDTRLRTDRLVTGRLRGVLERVRPDIVYLPFFLDRHEDHRATNDVLLAATAGSALDFECRGYEVWTPLFPNCLVKIDQTIESKKRALVCYQSQLAVVDYLHTGIGLNAYRSLALGTDACRYVEAFHALALADYRRLHRALSQ